MHWKSDPRTERGQHQWDGIYEDPDHCWQESGFIAWTRDQTPICFIRAQFSWGEVEDIFVAVYDKRKGPDEDKLFSLRYFEVQGWNYEGREKYANENYWTKYIGTYHHPWQTSYPDWTTTPFGLLAEMAGYLALVHPAIFQIGENAEITIGFYPPHLLIKPENFYAELYTEKLMKSDRTPEEEARMHEIFDRVWPPR